MGVVTNGCQDKGENGTHFILVVFMSSNRFSHCGKPRKKGSPKIDCHTQSCQCSDRPSLLSQKPDLNSMAALEGVTVLWPKDRIPTDILPIYSTISKNVFMEWNEIIENMDKNCQKLTKIDHNKPN